MSVSRSRSCSSYHRLQTSMLQLRVSARGTLGKQQSRYGDSQRQFNAQVEVVTTNWRW